MAKKSNRRRMRSRKGDTGCMWGLINMFDFRQNHSARRLLSDTHGNRKVGTSHSKAKTNVLSDSEETEGEFDDVNEVGAGIASRMPTVKVLMEEEMSRAHKSRKIPAEEVERIRSDLGIGIHTDESCKKTGKSSKLPTRNDRVDRKDASSFGDSYPSFPNTPEITNLDTNLANFMVDFYSKSHLYLDELSDLEAEIKEVGVKNDSKIPDIQSDLQKAVGDVAEVIFSRKLTGMKSLPCNREVIESKEFMDALEILSSNKDLFVKLLQDPNSFLFKHMNDLQNMHCRKSSELLGEDIARTEQPPDSSNHKGFHKQDIYNFFKRKDKLPETKPSKKGDISNSVSRIVVLKPNPPKIHNPSDNISLSSSPLSENSLKCQEQREEVGSHFSFKEIKRRLRYAIGENKKEKRAISMDGIRHKIPYGSKDLGKSSKTHDEAFQASQHSKKSSTKKTSFQDKTNKKSFSLQDAELRKNMINAAHLLERECFSYKEARKHLAERFDAREDRKQTLQHNRSSKLLGRIISLPEYSLLSPQFSPGRDIVSPEEFINSPKQQNKQECPINFSSPPREDIKARVCIHNELDDGKELDCLTLTVEDTGEQDTNVEESAIAAGNTTIVNVEHFLGPKDQDNLSKPSESIMHEENTATLMHKEETSAVAELMIEPIEESKIVTPLEPIEESKIVTPFALISPEFLLIHNAEDADCILKKSDRPSPVSVLEPVFSEESVSPDCTSAEDADFPLKPRQLLFEDRIVLAETNTTTELNDIYGWQEYVKIILDSSGLICNEIWERWYLADQFLEQSLFHDKGISYTQFSEDRKLLFDCVDAVILEIQENYFCCTPWMCLVKANTRLTLNGDNVIQEVCRRINWHLKVQFPSTLDQIIRKDLTGGCWMDLRVEFEKTISQLGDDIIDYIMEETILELWD